MTALLEHYTPPAPPPPVHYGPTWKPNPTWKPEDGEAFRYVLPEITLGWQIIRWIQENLLADEIDPLTGEHYPFDLTFEQRRFILWWYAIDEHGVFAYRTGVLQRLKGWGKDPLAAVLAAVELVGPCRFAGWTTIDRPDLGLRRGDPVGIEHPRAWIRVAAVSKTQTKNTMLLFQGLFRKECIDRHKINLGMGVIYAHGGTRQIQAVTSSPSSLEGGRPTFLILNETHHWREGNQGHAMFEVVERDTIKAKGGGARTLSITNAYEDGEDSVAQRQREAWEEEAAGIAFATGVLYDSLEAHEDAKLRLDFPEDLDVDLQEKYTRDYIGAVLEGVRGDATWLDIPGMVSGILRRSTKPSTARRFWYNQVRGAEDAWADPHAVDVAVEPLARAERTRSDDAIRAGWIVTSDEPIAMFFDGSKSDDSTVLVGCRISDGYTFVIGVWQKPRGDRSKERWLAPRGEVDSRVTEAFERFRVIAFWADPSHADDDEGGRYWDGLINDWHRRYKHRLTLWAVKTGDNQHSVMWDMASPTRSDQFAAAAMLTIAELEHRNADDTEFAPQFRHDGNPLLVAHMKNARRHPVGRNLVSLAKAGRESLKKIDLAVGLVGAQMMRRLLLNAEPPPAPEKGKQPGEVW